MEVIAEGLGEGIEEGIVAGIAEVNSTIRPVGVVAEGVGGGIAGIYQLVENCQFIARWAACNPL